MVQEKFIFLGPLKIIEGVLIVLSNAAAILFIVTRSNTTLHQTFDYELSITSILCGCGIIVQGIVLLFSTQFLLGCYQYTYEIMLWIVPVTTGFLGSLGHSLELYLALLLLKSKQTPRLRLFDLLWIFLSWISAILIVSNFAEKAKVMKHLNDSFYEKNPMKEAFLCNNDSTVDLTTEVFIPDDIETLVTELPRNSVTSNDVVNLVKRVLNENMTSALVEFRNCNGEGPCDESEKKETPDDRGFNGGPLQRRRREESGVEGVKRSSKVHRKRDEEKSDNFREESLLDHVLIVNAKPSHDGDFGAAGNDLKRQAKELGIDDTHLVEENTSEDKKPVSNDDRKQKETIIETYEQQKVGVKFDQSLNGNHEGKEVLKFPETKNIEEGQISIEEGEQISIEEGGQINTEERHQINMEEGSQINTEIGDQINTEQGHLINIEEGDQISIEEKDQINTEEGHQINTEEGDQMHTEEGDQVNTEERDQINIEEESQINTEEGGQINFEEGDQKNTEEWHQINTEEGHHVNNEEVHQINTEVGDQIILETGLLKVKDNPKDIVDEEDPMDEREILGEKKGALQEDESILLFDKSNSELEKAEPIQESNTEMSSSESSDEKSLQEENYGNPGIETKREEDDVLTEDVTSQMEDEAHKDNPEAHPTINNISPVEMPKSSQTDVAEVSSGSTENSTEAMVEVPPKDVGPVTSETNKDVKIQEYPLTILDKQKKILTKSNTHIIYGSYNVEPQEETTFKAAHNPFLKGQVVESPTLKIVPKDINEISSSDPTPTNPIDKVSVEDETSNDDNLIKTKYNIINEEDQDTSNNTSLPCHALVEVSQPYTRGFIPDESGCKSLQHNTILLTILTILIVAFPSVMTLSNLYFSILKTLDELAEKETVPEQLLDRHYKKAVHIFTTLAFQLTFWLPLPIISLFSAYGVKIGIEVYYYANVYAQMSHVILAGAKVIYTRKVTRAAQPKKEEESQKPVPTFRIRPGRVQPLAETPT